MKSILEPMLNFSRLECRTQLNLLIWGLSASTHSSILAAFMLSSYGTVAAYISSAAAFSPSVAF
jgi:hypothetical protein